MLQQRWDLVGEGAFHHPREGVLAGFRVVAAGEMHHPYPMDHQSLEEGPHHAVEAYGPLAAAHHHQQGSLALGHPGGQGRWVQKLSPHRGARDHGPASPQSLGCLGEADRQAGAMAA